MNTFSKEINIVCGGDKENSAKWIQTEGSRAQISPTKKKKHDGKNQIPRRKR
jgi:hypothetical protein